MADYKPAGFSSVTPYLVVPDADRMLKFLTDAFGAEEISVHRRDDYTIMHAEMRIGDSIIELGQANGRWTPTQSSLHLYVPDTDAAYEKALGAGADSLTRPTNAPYGDRAATVIDPAGNQWFLATVLFR
jgi:PhnB protein